MSRINYHVARRCLCTKIDNICCDLMLCKLMLNDDNKTCNSFLNIKVNQLSVYPSTNLKLHNYNNYILYNNNYYYSIMNMY